jgi:hypothetical protein
MTASLSVSPGSQPYCLVVKGDGPQQQHAVSPASARIEKHRPSMLHQDTSRFGSVSSLPPYEALYGAARSAQEVLPILDADPEEAEGPLDQTGLLLVPTPGTPQVSIHSIDDDAELELDDSIQLDRLVLRSSLALAAAQSLLAGTLSVRGAILDLNTRDVEGDAGLERIEVETRIRSVALDMTSFECLLACPLMLQSAHSHPCQDAPRCRAGRHARSAAA